LAAVVLFDAILTGWVSKHNSVGLISLQRRCSSAVAAQRRSIPKCSLHFGIVRRGFSSAENAQNYFAAEKYSITNPTGWDGVKKYYRRQLRLSSSPDGVPWGMVKNETCRQYSLSLRLMPILTPLSSRWTVPLRTPKII
jgi:hypothetical protein